MKGSLLQPAILTASGARYYPPTKQPRRPQIRAAAFQLESDSASVWRRRTTSFNFIDLFAGIGGFRIAFELEGGNCTFSSEWDQSAKQTYSANFGDEPHGDIHECKGLIPDHDVLVAGFPCQPFSIAGVSKKNSLGRDHGFKDKTQGTLFFEILDILERRMPAAFVLENVKHLRNHDQGKTYSTIIESLRDVGYHVFDKIVDAKSYVPQHRERIFIVGFREFCPFDFPAIPETRPTFDSILERNVDDKYHLSRHLWKYLRDYAEKHRAKGNGFGFSLTPMDGIARTLSARYYKDGSEILIDDGQATPRRLTPRECANLMGFPAEFKIVVSDTQAYKQFGNSVVVPVARSVAACVVRALGVNRTHRSRRIDPKKSISKTASI